MIINFSNLGGGGGGGYTLPTATSQTLGGVKIGSGVTVTSDGTISVEGSDSSVLKSVEEFPLDAELGDVVSLASSGESYPNGITYERRTYTDGDGVRFTFPNGSLTGHTSDNPVFLGTVSADNGTAYEMYAHYDTESHINVFTITLNGDLSDPNCTIYMSDGEQGVTPYQGAAYEFDIVGQDMIIDVYPDSSMGTTSLAFEGLPEGGSLGVFQYDGEEWNQIGAGGGSADYLPMITTLPDSPVDGAVYNYNGLPIRYVNGPGNWGEWVGNTTNVMDGQMDNLTCINLTTFNYAVMPASIDGQMLCNTRDIYYVFDLQNNALLGKLGSSAGTTTYTIYKDGASVSADTRSGSTLPGFVTVITWSGNKIAFDCGKYGVTSAMTPTSSTGHYELVEDAESFNFDFNKGGYGNTSVGRLITYIDENGRVTGAGLRVNNTNIKMNNQYYKQYLTNYDSSYNQLPYFWAPVSAGNADDILVSSGSGAPIWKTIAQALGVSFWTGTQDEYDDLGTYSPTTLYIIIPE